MLKQHVLMDFAKQQPKYLLCCANGLVDLRTGEFLGPPKPDHLVTQICPTNYNPNADMKPAIQFFENMFPEEEYPDYIGMVQCLQQYMGYSLSLATDQQICLYMYGRGSNCKSLLYDTLKLVLGESICRHLPIESLNKPRGTNNDSLLAARNTRLVVVNESNGKAKIDTGTYNALVCGEDTTTKGMYKEECNITTVMKLLFLLNDLPEWTSQDGTIPFHIQRRNAYVHLKKQYLDEDNPAQKIQIDELIDAGKPWLVEKRNNNYFAEQVVGNEEGFLRFFVEGHIALTANGGKLVIPQSMQLQV